MTADSQIMLRKVWSAFRGASPIVRARAVCGALTRPIHDVIIRVPPKTPVLDFGSGDGLFSALLAGTGCEATAVEPDPVRRPTAERLFGGMGIRFAARLDDLPAGERFGVILVVDVFHLIPRGQRPAVARRLAQMLKPGGRAVIKEVAATSDWRESVVTSQERLVHLLVAGDIGRPVELPTPGELNALAALFGPVTEVKDLPVGWYMHRCVVAGGGAHG